MNQQKFRLLGLNLDRSRCKLVAKPARPQARGAGDRERQAGGRDHAAFLLPLPRQRGAAVLSLIACKPRELVASAGVLIRGSQSAGCAKLFTSLAAMTGIGLKASPA